MNIDDIKKLNELLKDMQCKNCIFSKTCDHLVDNYKKDICQIIEGELNNEYTAETSRD